MNCIKAVVFDMDGVLLDSETVCLRTWKEAGKEFNLNDIEKTLRKCLGTNRTDTFAILKNIYGNSFDAEKFMLRTSELFYEIEKKEGLNTMPHAVRTLEYLKEKYPLALATSTRRKAAVRQLQNTGLEKYFRTFTFGDMVEHSKPEPEIYLIACKSLGISPEECAAVEDSPNGIRSAFSAGMKCIMVPDKIKPSEDIKKLCWKICPSLKELEQIL